MFLMIDKNYVFVEFYRKIIFLKIKEAKNVKNYKSNKEEYSIFMRTIKMSTSSSLILQSQK
jgi:hypothetical protein